MSNNLEFKNIEVKTLLISFGIVIAGNLLKLANNDTGNLVQGIGLGSGLGVVSHAIAKKYPSSFENLPNHDVIGLVSLPVIYLADKSNLIENKSITNNLYGGAIGLTMQHLLTQGCSFCGTGFCQPGINVCGRNTA